MSSVTDVDHGEVSVEVVDDDDKDVSAVDQGRESVVVRTRLDALRDSVVARLLMDNRPPHLHTSACPLTTRRPPDDRAGLRSVPPPVDLSAGKTKLDVGDGRQQRLWSGDAWPYGDPDVTSASRRLQLLQQQLPHKLDLSTVLSDCKLGNRWLDICSYLSRSPPTTSVRRASTAVSSQQQQPSACHPPQSSTANVGDIKPPQWNRTTEERSLESRSGSSQVLPALRHLLLKPVVGPGWNQPVHGSYSEKLASSATRDSNESPPTLKPEPLSTTPKVKHEAIAHSQLNGRLKTTSGFQNTADVRESRPPRKRRPEVCACANSNDCKSGEDAGKLAGSASIGNNNEYPTQNGLLSKPEVETHRNNLLSTPPDVAGDRSPKLDIMQRSEGSVVDRRPDGYFVHAPRKRFRYEFLSYVDNIATANGQVTAAATAGVDVGKTGSGNDVINLTTSTRASSGHERTRDVAVQCVLMGDAEGFSDVYHQQPSVCDWSTSEGNLASFYCWYCRIAFDDDVLHAIHMGCHSVADKFVCNVCGMACGDRYGFNSHLVRGHIQATAVSEKPAAGSVLSLQLPGTAQLVTQTTALPSSTRPTSTTADFLRPMLK